MCSKAIDCHEMTIIFRLACLHFNDDRDKNDYRQHHDCGWLEWAEHVARIGHARNTYGILDFKLSPCSVYCMLSFG